MSLSETQKHHLTLLKDIHAVSSLCSTKTYIWAGLVRDIITGAFLREHSDVDGFTLNLWGLREKMAALYKQRGYTISFVKDVGFLRIERNGVHAVFNQLELDGETALWRHAGNEGTVYFPKQWLSDVPFSFYDMKILVSGIEFEYAIKMFPQLLNPEWKSREKDFDTITWLNKNLDERNINPIKILKRIWSYNPYWAKRGFKEYTMPCVAWRLDPIGFVETG
ncbi:MAG: hypothetical protein DWQ04_08470 [Chloroflexi bacterium]|nr:MAG: hypothetical protein DWQ04_08470 [Chloroflexota bacterium]